MECKEWVIASTLGQKLAGINQVGSVIIAIIKEVIFLPYPKHCAGWIEGFKWQE